MRGFDELPEAGDFVTLGLQLRALGGQLRLLPGERGFETTDGLRGGVIDGERRCCKQRQ